MASDDPFADMGDESPAGDLDAMDFMGEAGDDEAPAALPLGDDPAPPVSTDALAEVDPHALVDDGPLQKWQANRAEVLDQRRQEERDAKAKAAQDAKKTVEEFRESRRERIAGAYTKAQHEEAETKADMDRVLQSGTLWEKVGKLVDLQPKKNDTRDIDRMRLLLLQMKNKQ